MALPFNAAFHQQSRAIANARVARGVAFDAKQPRQQRDPSYKGVPPNSTGSWATPYTINHDESWKPLVPLRKQEMDLWNQENTYRYMLSRDMITGGFSRSPAAQSYFNERLKQKGAQATKLYNPYAPGRRIRKALAPADFGKYELAQMLERLDNQLDTMDKVSLMFDKSTADLIDRIRSHLFTLAPSFTVSEAQNTFETIGSILQKAEALLGTALGEDTEHMYEVGEEYTPEKLEVNTKRLAVFVSSIRKLYTFMERVYGGASTENETARSRMAVAAAQDLFSRAELGSITKEADAAVKRWQNASVEDEKREGEEQAAAEEKAASLAQREAMAEGEDVPAFDARETTSAARLYIEDAGQPVGETATAAFTPLRTTAVFLPFTRDELSQLSDGDITLIVGSVMRGEDNVRDNLIEENGLDWSKEFPGSSLEYPVPRVRPKSAAQWEEFQTLRDRTAKKIIRQVKSAAAMPVLEVLDAAAAEEEASAAAPAAAAAAAAPAEPAIPKPGAGRQARDDWIKWAYQIRKPGLSQSGIVRALAEQGVTISQGQVSKIINSESKSAFRERTGF
jgi:hypothetical protein